MKLFVTFEYPIDDPDALTIDTDIKASYIPDVIEAYLQGVVGAGKDSNEAKDLEVYGITLTMCDDSIKVDSNCGNLGLVAGILTDILKRLHESTGGQNS